MRKWPLDRVELVLVFVTILVVLVVIFHAVIPSAFGQETDFERRSEFIQECLTSELYSREECIMMPTGDD